MGRIRSLGQKVASRLAGHLRGEEPAPSNSAPPTTPYARPPVLRTTPAPPPAPRAAPSVAAPAAPSRVVQWPEECQGASLDAIRAALGPGRGLRVVNHWATWCDPCVEELPLLVSLHLRLEDRAEFLGVCWELFDDSRDPEEVAAVVADFAANRAVRYRSLLVTDPADRFFAGLDLRWQKIPQTWVIAPDGRVLHRVEGALDEESAEALAAVIEAAAPRA